MVGLVRLARHNRRRLRLRLLAGLLIVGALQVVQRVQLPQDLGVASLELAHNLRRLPLEPHIYVRGPARARTVHVRLPLRGVRYGDTWLGHRRTEAVVAAVDGAEAQPLWPLSELQMARWKGYMVVYQGAPCRLDRIKGFTEAEVNDQLALDSLQQHTRHNPGMVGGERARAYAADDHRVRALAELLVFAGLGPGNNGAAVEVGAHGDVSEDDTQRPRLGELEEGHRAKRLALHKTVREPVNKTNRSRSIQVGVSM